MANLSEWIDRNKIKGAIFDMDGTLTDSMGRWGEIYEGLGRILGVRLPQDFLMKVNHIPMRKRVNVILEEFALEADEEEVYGNWLRYAMEFYERVFQIKPYMLETLKTLREKNTAMAVATASDVGCAYAFIGSNRLDGYFRSVTGLDEVSRPKSFPDIYLKAAEKLGVKPCECLVFEDALTAIGSAKGGGFFVCGVQDSCSRKDEGEIKRISDITLGF